MSSHTQLDRLPAKACVCTEPLLLLCSAQELGQLQCPPLEAVIARERLRLASLHSLLFPGVVHCWQAWLRLQRYQRLSEGLAGLRHTVLIPLGLSVSVCLAHRPSAGNQLG